MKSKFVSAPKPNARVFRHDSTIFRLMEFVAKAVAKELAIPQLPSDGQKSVQSPSSERPAAPNKCS